MAGYTTPPTIEQMAEMADQALAEIPPELARMVQGVAIQVVDFPDDDTLREMEMDNPYELLGLYSGVPFGQKSSLAVAERPDMIFLYRQPILAYWCDTDEDLMHVVRHVLIHEIGHHFGMSDADMEAIEAGGSVSGG